MPDETILLGCLTGVDSRDEATQESTGKVHRDYTRFLDRDARRSVWNVADWVYGDRDTGGSTAPAGFVSGLPVGRSFFGRAWSEPTLLKLAFAFDQATKFRAPPKCLPSVISG